MYGATRVKRRAQGELDRSKRERERKFQSRVYTYSYTHDLLNLLNRTYTKLSYIAEKLFKLFCTDSTIYTF